MDWSTRMFEEFTIVKTFLRQIEKKIDKRKKSVHTLDLRILLDALRNQVRQTRNKELPQLKQTMESKFRAPLGPWDWLWPELRPSPFLRRRIELDTRFQLQLGKAFATFLREEGQGVSLETIARLIVLVYLVGQLAGEDPKKGGLLVYPTSRPLTVRKVRENLRYHGLHKAEAWSQK